MRRGQEEVTTGGHAVYHPEVTTSGHAVYHPEAREGPPMIPLTAYVPSSPCGTMQRSPLSRKCLSFQ